VRQAFAYLNSRIRNRRAQLLPEPFFQRMLEEDYPGFLRALEETSYGPDLAGDRLSDVDRAISANLARTVGDLYELTSGPPQEAVRLLLYRADLVNLKAILRGKIAGESAEEIRGRLSGGTFSEPLVQAMLQAPDPASLAQVLQLPSHPLARALQQAVAQTQDPKLLEVLLERNFFSYLLSRARRLGERELVSYFLLEIDSLNLATAFKLSQQGSLPADLELYRIPEGTLVSPVLFSRLAGGDLGALEALAGTPLAPAAQARDLASLERILRRILLERAHVAAQDSLGAGLALDYVRSREWEGARLRLLARRAYFNLPQEAVREEVFL